MGRRQVKKPTFCSVLKQVKSLLENHPHPLLYLERYYLESLLYDLQAPSYPASHNPYPVLVKIHAYRKLGFLLIKADLACFDVEEGDGAIAYRHLEGSHRNTSLEDRVLKKNQAALIDQ